jgi:hypothetical protein
MIFSSHLPVWPPFHLPGRHPHVHPVQRVCPLLEPPPIRPPGGRGRRLALRGGKVSAEPLGRNGDQDEQVMHSRILGNCRVVEKIWVLRKSFHIQIIN